MNLRTALKTAAAWTVTHSGLDAVARRRLHRAMPFIVGYHRVVERLGTTPSLPSMEVSVAMLERHLDWIARHFDVITLDDLVATSPRRSAKPAAAITFDDGYRDAYDHAFPLLRKKGLPAAFFIVTDIVGSAKAPVHEDLYAALARTGRRDPFDATRKILRSLPHADVIRLIERTGGGHDVTPPELQPLTWEMVRAMAAAGMTIGSHTRTHAFLANESQKRIREEVEGSRREIERRTGSAPLCFAYPGGSFNRTVVEEVARAGYRLAFTDCRHSYADQPMLTLPRRGLWQQSCVDASGHFSPGILSCHSAALFDHFSRCNESH